MDKAMMSRRGFVAVAGISALAVTMGISPTKAHAVSGSSIRFGAAGKSCNSYAACAGRSGGGGFGTVNVSASSTLSPGDAGATVYLTKDGDTAGVSTYYNTAYTTSFMAQVANSASGLYYSSGYALGLVTSTGGYNVYSVPPTSTYYYRSTNPLFAVSEYETNEDGLEYGSILSADSVGHAPALVSAIATNGEQGYVYEADMQAMMPKNSEEALGLMEDQGYKYIAVYALDGHTVIGEFGMYFGEGLASVG